MMGKPLLEISAQTENRTESHFSKDHMIGRMALSVALTAALLTNASLNRFAAIFVIK